MGPTEKASATVISLHNPYPNDNPPSLLPYNP